MMQADDAYAGSQSFIRLQTAVKDVLGKDLLLPVHLSVAYSRGP
jgi:tryptophanase